MQKRIIIKQQDEKDCGVCCLESLIKYYNGYVPIEKIREDTNTSHKGTSAYHMVETLKKYGFDAYGTKIKKERFFLVDFPLPAIVHVVLDNGLNHYMVLYEKRKDKVILMDPSIGKKVMSDTDFFWIWSEVLLIAYPKEKIVVDGKEENLLVTMLSFLGQNKKKLNILIVIEIFYLIISIGSTFYLKVALKYLNRKYELIIIICFFLFFCICNILIHQHTLKKSRLLNRTLGLLHTTSYFDHLLNLPLKLFKSRNLNDYLTRFWENFELKYIYSDFCKNFLISSIKLFTCFSLLSILNNTFFHYFLLVLGLYFFFQLLIQNRIFKLEKEMILIKNEFQNKLLDTLSSYELYHYLNLKDNLRCKNEKNLIYFLRKDEEKNKFYQTFIYLQNTLKEIINFTFLTLGIYMMYQEKLEFVDFILIESIGLHLIDSLEKILSLIPKEKYLKNFLLKESNFLTLEKEQIKKMPPIENNDITFSNIDFTYDQFHYVLKNFNLIIHQNEHIQLFGPSGCGKSTICDLLLKTYLPTKGDIKIGKTNIADIEISSLRKTIVYLNQRSKLILGTIKENIMLDRNFDQKRFEKVCNICHLDEIIEKKPLRYETHVSNEENNLSGGEKQRIMLARVLYSDASIFLLDESLSEIGEKMEKEIIKNIREFLNEKTLIYISHKNYKSLFDEIVKLEVVNERVLIS